MKNSLFPLSIVVAIVAGFIAFHATQTVGHMQKTLDLERFQRLSTEEKLQQTELKVGHLQAEVESSQSKLEKIQGVLSGTESTKNNLISEMDRIAREKQMLEEKLKTIENPVGSTALNVNDETNGP